MLNNVQSWEDDGNYCFSDGSIIVWTTELIDIDSLEYDDRNGWIYKGSPIYDVTICEA